MKKEKKEKEPFLLSRLLPHMGKKRFLFPLALITSAISAVLNILPFIFIWLIAKEVLVLGSVNQQAVFNYSIYALISAVVAIAAYFLALSFSHFAAFHAEVNMRKNAMSKIIKMPLGYFGEHESGAIRKAIDDGAGATHGLLAHQMPDLAGVFISPIILLVLVFIFDWRLGLASLFPLVLGFSLMKILMDRDTEAFVKYYNEYLAKMSSEATEYVRNIPVVKTFGQSIFSFKRFYNAIVTYRDFSYKYTKLWHKPMTVYTVLVQSTAFFLVPLAILLIGRTGNIGQVLVDFVFYILVTPMFSLLFMRSVGFQNQMAMTKGVIDRYDEALKYLDLKFKREPVITDNFTFDLEFKNVSFKYATSEKKVIDDISFKIEKGQRVALVGFSGGGKTTLARLASRFWDVDEGEVLIGGVNVKEIPEKELMENVSFVFQNTKLFKTSLRENILYGKQNVSEEELNRAIELSQSKEIIDSLPDGLNTVIGKEGTYLSGGEQQRIALARAFLKDAPIVLLDEATAFADPENEHLIQKALKELSIGKTTLMIAHRLTSVMDADLILVIDEGKIVEQGTHEDLLEKGSMYKSMWDEYQKAVAWKI